MSAGAGEGLTRPRPRRAQDEALLDDIIDRLLDVRNGRPGKQVALSESEVRAVGGGGGPFAGVAEDGALFVVVR